MKFVRELVAWSPRAVPFRAARLDHEVRDHSVEFQAVIKSLPGELFEIAHRARSLVVEQLRFDRAARSNNRGDLHERNPFRNILMKGGSALMNDEVELRL